MLNHHALSYMQEIRLFFTSEQKFYNPLNSDFISKYFLVVFAFSVIRWWLEQDYVVNPTQL